MSPPLLPPLAKVVVQKNKQLIVKAAAAKDLRYESFKVAASEALFRLVEEHCQGNRSTIRDLLKLFFDGVLHATSDHLGPLVCSHAVVHSNTLHALADAGVLTCGGQERCREPEGVVQRAYVQGVFVAPSFASARATLDSCGCCYAMRVGEYCVLNTFGDDGPRKELKLLGTDEEWIPEGSACVGEKAGLGRYLKKEFIWVTLDGLMEFTNVAVAASVFGVERGVNSANEVLVGFMMWDSEWPRHEGGSTRATPDECLVRAMQGRMAT